MSTFRRVKFTDFWRGFQPDRHYLFRLLADVRNVRLSEDPDLLIYSCFGREHERFKCRKVFYTGENVRPDFRECDYAFTFDHLDSPRHYRLPLYATLRLRRMDTLVRTDNFNAAETLASKTRFCNFVYSNPRCKLRNRFLDKLSQYRRVDSAGKWRNNMGGSPPGPAVEDKHAFLRQYKFTIAFENSSYPGYTTEKLLDAFLTDTLPIYWGNPVVARDFNTASFLNYHDFASEQALIEEIIRLDNDDDAYIERIRQPPLIGNRVPQQYSDEALLAQWSKILSDDATPVSQTGSYRRRLARQRAVRQLINPLTRTTLPWGRSAA